MWWPAGPARSPRRREEAGEHLTEKPVTLAIQEVADGKLDARRMDLTIEEPEDVLPEEQA